MPAKAGIQDAAPSDIMRAMGQACVYILASKRNGTLYVGTTNNVARRVWEHESDAVDG